MNKFKWLVFHYDFSKLNEIRKDFQNHDSEITFKYACASVKTFIKHNPKRINDIEIWTDDPIFLNKIFIENGVDLGEKIINIKNEIDADKKHPYPWKVKSAFLERHFNETSFFVDNDCICKKNVDELVNQLNDSTIILWEFERQITNTRPYWGWQMATEYLKRPFTYWVANDGIIGITKNNLINHQIMNKSAIMCEDIYNNVNISSRFPDRHPKLMISQQMAMCYAAQDLNLRLIESKEYFDHFYADKKKCLEFL